MAVTNSTKKLKAITWIIGFKLDVSAATMDQTVATGPNGEAVEVYTQFATANWQMDARGDVAETDFAWTLTGEGFTPKSNGNANKWTTENGIPYPDRSSWKTARVYLSNNINWVP